MTDWGEHDEEKPRGTMLLMGLFVLMIVGMWIWTFWLLWQRGA